jgi:hypothetical protein
MPLSLKADAARKRHSYRHMSDEQHARRVVLKARHRPNMTTEQRAHQHTLRAQRRSHQRQQAITSHWWSTLSSVTPRPYVQTWLSHCVYCGVQRLATESVNFSVL